MGRGSGTGGKPPRNEAWRRDVLVVALTLTTGALDAATFLRLGNVFSSVITGNLVLLGVAAGRANATLAVNGGLALAGYAAGALAGGAVAGHHSPGQPTWPRRVTVTLGGELFALVAFSGGWLAAGGSPAGGSRLALLVVGAAAMGMQSTAVRRLGQMSSTYLTSTLTGLVSGLAAGALPSGWPRSLGALAALVAGAVLGALAVTHAFWAVPAAILIPEGVVVALTAVDLARDRRAAHPPR